MILKGKRRCVECQQRVRYHGIDLCRSCALAAGYLSCRDCGWLAKTLNKKGRCPRCVNPKKGQSARTTSGGLPTLGKD